MRFSILDDIEVPEVILGGVLSCLCSALERVHLRRYKALRFDVSSFSHDAQGLVKRL